MNSISRIILIPFLATLFSIGVLAQRPISLNFQGEMVVDIHGNNFAVRLNDADKTATIENLGEYKVDTRSFAFFSSRKFKKIDKSKKLVIPSSLTIGGAVYTVVGLGNMVFADYQNILSVEIPETIVSIGDYAFYHTSLTNVDMTSSVEHIGKRAFGECKKLKEITLPNPSLASADLYSESKQLSVKFLEYSKQVAARKAAKKEKPKIVYALSSDVDVNIPQTSKTNGETFAVIIANENYDKEVKVECAHNDGQTFRKYCEQTLGVPKENIRYIEDATLGNMMEEINWLVEVAKVYAGDAKIIVYYAGHGIPDESSKTAYLLPVDVAGSNTNGAYQLGKLYNTLGSLNAKNVTVFLDACFSGSQRGDGMLSSARGVAIKAKTEDPMGNMIVFSAAQGNETAYPYAEKGHGLFTYFLLKKLQDSEGDVKFGELSEYLQKEVGRKAVVINKKPQTPTVSYSTKMQANWRNVTLK